MENLSADAAQALCARLISGETSTAQIRETLLRLRHRGETAEEIAGFSRAIVARAQRIPFRHQTYDLCGTGGSALDRFNVSTSVAFLVSCLGVPIAKHGNKGSRRPNGSFDLLERLGIPIELDGGQLAHLLETTNLAFIYARRAHPALQHVAEARRQIEGRTIFNLAGPLSNPTNVRCQLIGTADPAIQARLLEAARLMGRREAAVVHGAPGIDEVSIAGPTRILRLSGDTVIEERFVPEDLGVRVRPYDALPAGEVEDNAATFERLLDDDPLEGIRDMVCLNAALFLRIAGVEADDQQAFHRVRRVIRSGQMKAKFLQYRDAARAVARPGATSSSPAIDTREGRR